LVVLPEIFHRRPSPRADLLKGSHPTRWPVG
jgi:hypothetical protein